MSLFFLWAVSAATILFMGWGTWWYLNKIHPVDGDDNE